MKREISFVLTQMPAYNLQPYNIMIIKRLNENFGEVLLNRYAQFSGKAGRQEFWQFVLMIFLFNLLLALLSRYCWVLKFICLLSILSMLVPLVALSVRRMHDIGKSGHWVWINLIPLLGTLWFLYLAAKPGLLPES